MAPDRNFPHVGLPHFCGPTFRGTWRTFSGHVLFQAFLQRPFYCSDKKGDVDHCTRSEVEKKLVGIGVAKKRHVCGPPPHRMEMSHLQRNAANAARRS